MPQATDPCPILDLHPPEENLAAEVAAGLAAERPTLPCKLFYDEAGSQLFEQITELPEYYPTRTELSILTDCRGELAEIVGDSIILVEYGSGSTTKVRRLLDGLDVAAYVPIDISRWYLEAAARDLGPEYPQLRVRPVLADYNQKVPLPDDLPKGPCVGFFPGGTIGNFTPQRATSFLTRVAATLGAGSYLLLGVDLRKDPVLLHQAYNDAAGVTARFNLNLLHRLNREFDAGFNLAHWRHYAPYNPVEGRIEMHLVAVADDEATINEQHFSFPQGCSIHTENSYKYTPRLLARVADQAGFEVTRAWTDEQRLFGVQLLRVR